MVFGPFGRWTWDFLKTVSPRLRERLLLEEEFGEAEAQGLEVRGQWVWDKRTGGVYTREASLGELAGKGKKHPVLLNVRRNLTSARYGFVPLSRQMARERLGPAGDEYYEEWWRI
jgi:hypothetical protein